MNGAIAHEAKGVAVSPARSGNPVWLRAPRNGYRLGRGANMAVALCESCCHRSWAVCGGVGAPKRLTRLAAAGIYGRSVRV